MAKVWVLDTDTKGTGAEMRPLEKVERKERPPAPRRGKRTARRTPAPAGDSQPSRGETRAGPLPPGHVRKKATGEIGKVRSVDPKGGTATVLWLKQGRTSTVPLASISRR